MRQLYQSLLLPRLIEERMLLALRQGLLSKWFSGIGQEAISVGATLALREDDFILPLHRNLGVFTTRGVPLQRIFSQILGKVGGFTRGRDRSFHFGSREHHIVGMISHLGPQLCVACGIALGQLGQGKVTLAFTGEGATSQGDFHEALNLASVWQLPVIFLIENNGFALSTPPHQQYRCQHLVQRAQAYGMEGHQVDGNDVQEVHRLISGLAQSIREQPRPVLVEALTFRMRGHEEASGTDYVSGELQREWAARDPLAALERQLLSVGAMTPEQMQSLRQQLTAEIQANWEAALQEPTVVPDSARELRDVYQGPLDVLRGGSPPSETSPLDVLRGGSPPSETSPLDVLRGGSPPSETSPLRYVDAVSEGLREAMRRHPELIFMGQDVADYGGVFKVSEGFLEEFGAHRVRNTPLCESAVVGAALGLAITGKKAVVEMQFSDFASCAYNQIVNNLAKAHYRWGQPADVVIRMPSGGGVGAGPFHSQTLEATFCHIAGLKVVYPAFPEDAKGLLLAAIEDPNPVLFLEHKALYRRLKGEVRDGYFTTPIGKARRLREGGQVTILTYGLGVHWALEVLDRHPAIQADLLDLRTLQPLDLDAVESSLRKTGKVIILHEDNLTGGVGAELAARIAADCFEYLDGPVVRSASLDTPIPFARELEEDYLPKRRFEQQLLELLRY